MCPWWGTSFTWIDSLKLYELLILELYELLIYECSYLGNHRWSPSNCGYSWNWGFSEQFLLRQWCHHHSILELWSWWSSPRKWCQRKPGKDLLCFHESWRCRDPLQGKCFPSISRKESWVYFEEPEVRSQRNDQRFIESERNRAH